MEGREVQLVENIDMEDSLFLLKLLEKTVITKYHYQRLKVNFVVNT